MTSNERRRQAYLVKYHDSIFEVDAHNLAYAGVNNVVVRAGQKRYRRRCHHAPEEARHTRGRVEVRGAAVTILYFIRRAVYSVVVDQCAVKPSCTAVNLIDAFS